MENKQENGKNKNFIDYFFVIATFCVGAIFSNSFVSFAVKNKWVDIANKTIAFIGILILFLIIFFIGGYLSYRYYKRTHIAAFLVDKRFYLIYITLVISTFFFSYRTEHTIEKEEIGKYISTMWTIYGFSLAISSIHISFVFSNLKPIKIHKINDLDDFSVNLNEMDYENEILNLISQAKISFFLSLIDSLYLITVTISFYSGDVIFDSSLIDTLIVFGVSYSALTFIRIVGTSYGTVSRIEKIAELQLDTNIKQLNEINSLMKEFEKNNSKKQK